MLFFVIRTVASFEMVPIWLNHPLPAVIPHHKAVLKRRFWNGLQLARRITLNRLDIVEQLSFERHFQFWEHPKVAGSYVGTVRRLAKLYNLVFRQKLLHKVRWMHWRVIAVKKLVTAWPETRSFSSHGITQYFQNFTVIFFFHRLTSWSKFVVHNTLTIEKNNQHWLDMAPTLTLFLTACTTPLSVLCLCFRPQRPSASFQSSPYNSCLDWNKTWCKLVDLFFLSFSTVNKCDEWKKHIGLKHTSRATQGVRPVTTAFREFVRDYCLRSYPVEANRALWREDINAGRILFGHTSYSLCLGTLFPDVRAAVALNVLTKHTRKSLLTTFEETSRPKWYCQCTERVAALRF